MLGDGTDMWIPIRGCLLDTYDCRLDIVRSAVTATNTIEDARAIRLSSLLRSLHSDDSTSSVIIKWQLCLCINTYTSMSVSRMHTSKSGGLEGS